jgi:uncharacterized protein
MELRKLGKSGLFFSALLLAIWMILPMAWAPEAAAAPDKVQLKMGGSTIGTLIYMQCAVLVDVWNRNIPGLDVTLVATPGSAANQIPIDRGDLDIASSSMAADWWALNGMHYMKTKLSNICCFLPANIGFHHAFTYVDSPIKTWKDMDGKRVALGARASATSLSNEEILNVLNIKPKFVFSNPAEAADMVKDRRVDALVYGVGAPYSMFVDIAQSVPIRFIPMDPGEQERVAKAIPYVFPGTLPSKTYSFQNEDWPSVVTCVNFIVRPGLSEEIVYKLTKVAWEHWDEVGKAVSAAKSVSPKDMVHMVAPIHPGAVKYYKEIGINIPDRLLWKK